MTKNINNLNDYINNIPNITATLTLNDTIYNWVPLSNPTIIKTDTYYLDSNKYKEFNTKTDKKIKLDPNVIYIIVVNGFTQYQHSMTETVMILQMYLNYFKNITINNKKISLISERRVWKSRIMTTILQLFNFENEILFIDNNKYYEGNFLYLKHYSGQEHRHPLGDILPCFPQKNAPVINELIKNANNKYKNEPYFRKLWISRRNMYNLEWNRRIITNTVSLSEIILENGFKEYFGENNIDPLYTIYLINKSSIIFGEPGTNLINLLFANEHTKLLTVKCPSHIWMSVFFNEICASSNTKYLEYKDCEDDIEHKDYIKGSFNRPYKINNINRFKEWFLENTLDSNK